MLRRSPLAALLAAGLGALGVLATWLLAFHVRLARTADFNVLKGFDGLDRGPLSSIVSVVPHTSDPQPFTVVAVLIVAVALLRGRPRLALAAALVLAACNLTTQELKPVFAAPRVQPANFSITSAAFPSGHATASMSLCLCAVLVASASWRPLVAALGAVYSLAVTYTLLVDGWHFPSDVVAGYLVAGTWTALAVAAVWAAERRWPDARGRPVRTDVRAAVAPAAAVLVGAGIFALVVALARPDAVEAYAREHTTFVVGAAIIAVLGLSLAAALSVALTTTRR